MHNMDSTVYGRRLHQHRLDRSSPGTLERGATNVSREPCCESCRLISITIPESNAIKQLFRESIKQFLSVFLGIMLMAAVQYVTH